MEKIGELEQPLRMKDAVRLELETKLSKCIDDIRKAFEEAQSHG